MAEPEALPTVEENHRSIVAPSGIEVHPSAVRLGEEWTRTLWIGEYPDAPADGLFETLYSTSETRQTDISIHLKPRDTRATLDSLENTIEELDATHEYLTERRRAGARGVAKDLADHQDLYDALRNTSMRAFDVSMYLTTRGGSREVIDRRAVAKTARRAPANLTPVLPRWAQLDALVAASPIGVDRLATSMDTSTPMLGAAVGAISRSCRGRSPNPESNTGRTRSTRARSSSTGSPARRATA